MMPMLLLMMGRPLVARGSDTCMGAGKVYVPIFMSVLAD